MRWFLLFCIGWCAVAAVANLALALHPGWLWLNLLGATGALWALRLSLRTLARWDAFHNDPFYDWP